MQIEAAAELARYRCHTLAGYGTSEGAIKGWDTRGRGSKALGRAPDVLRNHGWKEHPSKIRYLKPNPTVPGRKHYNNWQHPQLGELHVAYGAQGDFKHYQNGVLVGQGKANKDHPINELVHDYLNKIEGKPANPLAPNTNDLRDADKLKVKPPTVLAPPAQLSQNQTDQEQKLSTSKVSGIESLGGGTNVTQLVTLQDGTKAVFKPQDGAVGATRRNISMGMDTERERGAWEVAKVVGMGDMVPAVVERTIDGHRGALMEFRNGDVAGNHIGKEKYDGKEGLARAAMFDYVIGNTDRHTGNWLVEGSGTSAKLNLIDHGLVFPETAGWRGNTRLLDAQQKSMLSADTHQAITKYAEPYIQNKGRILATLSGLHLPEKAIENVGKRIDKLSEPTTRWMDLS